MSSQNTDESEDFSPLLTASEETQPQLFISVPPSLPHLERRRPGGLNGSRFGVGVEGPRYQEEATGQVWAAWVVLGIAIAMAIPGVVTVWATGEWVLIAVVAPFAGLFLAGMWRMIREEQIAKQKKIARMNRRLQDMNR